MKDTTIPCPHCGSTQLEIIEGQKAMMVERPEFAVGCVKCRACGPVALSVSGAIAAWEKRSMALGNIRAGITALVIGEIS